jgi:hypothetical protein
MVTGWLIEQKDLNLWLVTCYFDFEVVLANDYLCCNPSFKLATKARACEGAGQKWNWESHFMLPGVQESVREWTSTLPNELPLWELESQWTPKSSGGNFRGQNSLDR